MLCGGGVPGSVATMSIVIPASPLALVTRSALLRKGLSDSTIRRALTAKELTALAPGLYACSDHLTPPDAAAVHRAIAYSVAPGLLAGSVVSHLSAAALHGLPVPAGSPAVVHVTRPPPSKSRRGRIVWLHRGVLDPCDVVLVGGLPVTCPGRMVVDCSLTMDAAAVVPLAEAAVKSGLVDGGQLLVQLRRRCRAPGIGLAAALLAGVTGQP